MTILSLSGKIYVVNICFVINVNDFMTEGLTNYNNREEIPQNHNLFLEIVNLVRVKLICCSLRKYLKVLWDCVFVWQDFNQYW